MGPRRFGNEIVLMSLLNDALHRVQRLRGEKLHAEGLVRHGPTRQAAITKPAKRVSPLMWVMINAVIVMLVLVANHFFVRDPSPNVEAASVISPVPATAPIKMTVRAPAKQPVFSPVLPRAESVPESGPAELDYDLAGMTVLGKNTLLSITRRSDQQSFWVPVGKTVGEITAVSYNPEAVNASIRVRGQVVTIVMRNAAVLLHPATSAKR
jgi:hypothetical protein